MINLCALAMLTAVIIICVIFIRDVNININVNHNYEKPDIISLDDPFNEKGDLKEGSDRATIDDMVKEINKVMLGIEGEDYDA